MTAHTLRLVHTEPAPPRMFTLAWLLGVQRPTITVVCTVCPDWQAIVTGHRGVLAAAVEHQRAVEAS